MSMTRERIDEIRRRAEAATPGPWHVDHVSNNHDMTFIWGQLLANWTPWTTQRVFAGDVDIEDAAFIAHCREDVPDLLSALDRRDELIRFLERQSNVSMSSLASGKFMDAVRPTVVQYAKEILEIVGDGT